MQLLLQVQLSLLAVEEQYFLFSCRVVLESDSLDVQVLPADQSLHGPHFQRFQSIHNSKAILPCILTDFVEVFPDEFLFLNELYVGECIGGELDGLVESVLTAVAHIHELDVLGREAGVEHVRLGQLSLEVGASRKNKT